jgi:hypothetical protein
MQLDDRAMADLLVRPTEEIGKLRTKAAAAAVVGIVLAGIGLVVKGDAFWQSYLIGFYFWSGLTIGSMAVLMVQHLTGGGWSMVSRRILEASTRTLPLLAVLFVPIWLKMTLLYPWARPEAANDPIIQAKALYLNPTFFSIRAVLYFVIWGTMIYFLNKWSREQDENPPMLPGPQDRRSRVLSGPGVVIYVLTITFMSTDWVMSIDPHWYSTIYGIITLGGQGLSTMAFAIVVVSALARFRPMSEVLGTEQIHDLAKLMFAFVMLWGYFQVSQLIITWSGNLPEEIPFYLERLHGVWAPISIVVLLGEFVLPFLLLLSRSLKQNPRRVRRIALLILLARFIDVAWMIGPSFNRGGSSLSWVDFACGLAIGGIWLFYFFTNLAGRAVVPAKDPYFKEALAHGGH